MADVWTCCQCQTANLINNSPEKCPACEHSRIDCGGCKTGKPSMKSTSASVSYPPRLPLTPRLIVRMPTAPVPIGPALPSMLPALPSAIPTSMTGRQLAPPQTRTRAMAGHSMYGWWYCCPKSDLNSPALCAGRCTQCGHSKCRYCKPAVGRPTATSSIS